MCVKLSHFGWIRVKIKRPAVRRDVFILNCVILSLSIHTYPEIVISHDRLNLDIGAGFHFELIIHQIYSFFINLWLFIFNTPARKAKIL